MRITLARHEKGLQDEAIAMDVAPSVYAEMKNHEFVTFSGFVYRKEAEGVYMSIHPYDLGGL